MWRARLTINQANQMCLVGAQFKTEQTHVSLFFFLKANGRCAADLLEKKQAVQYITKRNKRKIQLPLTRSYRSGGYRSTKLTKGLKGRSLEQK